MEFQGRVKILNGIHPNSDNKATYALNLWQKFAGCKIQGVFKYHM